MAEPIVLGIVGIKNMGVYDADTTYEKLNVVTYQGSTYCALKTTKGNLPTNTEYWQLYCEKGDTGEQGEQGDMGPAPVKGVDYFTAVDKEEMESDLADDLASLVSESIGSLVSATPLTASSTSDMSDTTRIYVNTTDGHWYWYNGSAWTDGGIYQSTGINPDDANLINMVRGEAFVTDSNISSYASDLKNIIANRIYMYNVTPTNISNAPDNIGTLPNGKNLFVVYKLSMAYNNANYIMFLVDMSLTNGDTNKHKNNKMYVTSYSSSSNSFRWQELTTFNNSLHLNNYIYSANLTDDNKDLNNLVPNTITSFYLRGTQFAHAPIDMTSTSNFYLNVLTIGWNSSYYSQICIDIIGNNKFYYRSKNNNTWSDWVELNNHDQDLTKINEFIDYSYLTSVIQEPIDITNKNLTFAGDSITAGNFIGSSNVWAKWLSDKLNTSYTNKAVGGATFASVQGLTQIINEINNTTLNPVLFIAGGINDFSQNVSKADFTAAVDALCDWLDNNYLGTVIFVTPLNHIMNNITNTVPLDWYREEITRISINHGYSVIAGNEIGFPSTEGAMSDLMLYDRVHPSVTGQKVYANKVYQILNL